MRGLTRSVIALIVPPLPAPSRPSKRMQTFRPCTTHCWSLTNSTCRRASSCSYSFRFSLPSAPCSSFLASVFLASVIWILPSHPPSIQPLSGTVLICLRPASKVADYRPPWLLSEADSEQSAGKLHSKRRGTFRSPDVARFGLLETPESSGRPNALPRLITKTAAPHGTGAQVCAACDRCRTSRDRATRARYRQREQWLHWIFADRPIARSPL